MLDMLCSIMMVFFFNLMFIMTPVVMLLNILIISLMMSCMLAILYSNWFAYMIFLIYVGGMLVMFSYFVAMSPNQIMYLNVFVLSLFIFFLIMTMLLYSKYYMPFSFSYKSSFYMMYSSSYFYMLILLISLLLLMMLVVVKLVNTSEGPLRPFK
uniref:NADH dehydrogenase subunit 6 n=1 Tax=Whitmania acranulata TaxID=1329092 RepID=A0A0F6PBN1_WHICA|nr:NADH dehydrogenase subunit 6 [Whitmania acranulata]